MEYVCDASGDLTWFQIVTEGEAVAESEEMGHAVEKYFRREHDKAEASFKPASNVFFEQAIGLEGHIRRADAAFPDAAGHGRPGAGHRHAATRRQAGPFLHPDHRRSGECRSLSASR